MTATAEKTATHEVHAFIPRLSMTLYVTTYAGFPSEQAAKDAFLARNPHHAPENVTVHTA